LDRTGKKRAKNETWMPVTVASATPMEGREEGLSFSFSSSEMGSQTRLPLKILKFCHLSNYQPKYFSFAFLDYKVRVED